MKDLKTKEGRIAELKKIENSFLLTLRGNLFDVCPNAVCSIGANSIELGIAASGSYIGKGFKMAFASEVTLYASNPDSVFGRKENEINYGSSGCFNPTIEESYWRTIHAASMLKNWELTCSIVNRHCNMYSELSKQIDEANKVSLNSEGR